MAIDYDHLIYPVGRIHPDAFPDRVGQTLQTDVSGWVGQAMADPRVAALSDEAAQDRAVAAYVYWRAFDAAAIALAANPSTSQQEGAGTASYAKDQRDAFARLAREAKAEFEGAAPPIVSAYVGGGTRTVYHTFM